MGDFLTPLDNTSLPAKSCGGGLASMLQVQTMCLLLKVSSLPLGTKFTLVI